jgi:hypothetical protein
MTTTDQAVRRSRFTELQSRYYGLPPGFRLALRWALIVTTAAIAFHSSIASVYQTVKGGDANSYVVVVPIAAILAAIGVARRERTELPIHDRQTDIIVGTMGLVLALLLHAVLLQRYALYFHLLRLDLVAMSLFLLSSSIMLFGLRPVFRFRWVWGLLLTVFPLPYHIVGILLGGSKFAAGAVTLVIAAAATGISVGRDRNRGVLGDLLAFGFGLIVLVAMTRYFPHVSMLAFQLIPALTAIVVVGVGMFVHARRGVRKRFLERKVEPLAARQVWAAVPVVLLVGIALAFVRLPDLGSPAPKWVADPVLDTELTAPAGWHITDRQDYTWVRRLHGPGAALVRQTFVAATGNPKWDKFGRPRTVVVDTVTTDRPFSFNTYRAKVLYSVSAIRQSEPVRIDLGHGVIGELIDVVDDGILVTWNAMQFMWRNATSAQRVLIFTVDNHEPDAPFPAPTGAMISTLNTLFTVLLRGNEAILDRAPEFKDRDLLTQFGQALVAAQIPRLEA